MSEKEPKAAGSPARRFHYEMNMSVSRRGRYRLIWLGLIIGVVSGLTAVAYRQALSWAETLRETGSTALLNEGPVGLICLIVILLLIGLLVCLLDRSEPLIKGSGIPQVEGQLQGHFAPQWLRVLSRKFIGGFLCIVGGLSLGREGPSIQLGAMAAQGVLEKGSLSQVDRRYLLTCGACAGLSAAFNAPLAGLMFGLEEIQKNFSSRAIFPVLIASVSADVISKLFFGLDGSMGVSLPSAAMPLNCYWLYLLLGLVMGCFGAFYNRVLFGLQKAYKKLPLPDFLHPLLPFALAGVLAAVLPEVLGGGHGLITAMAAGHYGLRFLVLLLAVKFAFSMISFCSGAPGGIFFPLLVLGGLAGSIVGSIAVTHLGLPPELQTRMMLLGMAGMFSAVVRAPLTGIILVLEMSASLTQMLGLTIVAGLSWLVADLLHSRPVYEQMLENLVAAQGGHTQANRGELSIIEVTLPYKSALSGRRVREIPWPAEALLVSILRGDQQLMPKGSTRMQSGDVLAVACYAGDEMLIRAAIDDISAWAHYEGEV